MSLSNYLKLYVHPQGFNKPLGEISLNAGKEGRMTLADRVVVYLVEFPVRSDLFWSSCFRDQFLNVCWFPPPGEDILVHLYLFEARAIVLVMGDI